MLTSTETSKPTEDWATCRFLLINGEEKVLSIKLSAALIASPVAKIS